MFERGKEAACACVSSRNRGGLLPPSVGQYREARDLWRGKRVDLPTCFILICWHAFVFFLFLPISPASPPSMYFGGIFAECILFPFKRLSILVRAFISPCYPTPFLFPFFPFLQTRLFARFLPAVSRASSVYPSIFFSQIFLFHTYAFFPLCSVRHVCRLIVFFFSVDPTPIPFVVSLDF